VELAKFRRSVHALVDAATDVGILLQSNFRMMSGHLCIQLWVQTNLSEPLATGRWRVIQSVGDVY